MGGRRLRRLALWADTSSMHWLILLVPIAAALLLHNPRLNTTLLAVFARALALAGTQKDDRTSEPA